MTPQLIAFRAWVREMGGVTKVSRLLGHSVPYISRIHSGARTPGLQLAARIERVAGMVLVTDLPGYIVARDGIQAATLRLPAAGWVS